MAEVERRAMLHRHAGNKELRVPRQPLELDLVLGILLKNSQTVQNFNASHRASFWSHHRAVAGVQSLVRMVRLLIRSPTADNPQLLSSITPRIPLRGRFRLSKP